MTTRTDRVVKRPLLFQMIVRVLSERITFSTTLRGVSEEEEFNFVLSVDPSRKTVEKLDRSDS